jgi:hypothetical protein
MFDGFYAREVRNIIHDDKSVSPTAVNEGDRFSSSPPQAETARLPWRHDS